ncbi:NAD(P)-dependent dehydrogenase, short-chain alcohol dehydrogenase family [Cryptosporangium aurantiacum]|uniref:NAD(P)-dependent dehydrogenase, short-chain alcohol dehydrogenase family n=2 Tax=Cryptosporangium aurantiacum TaxID=134849 RepID=A0A1M7R4M3_9ACTN|nr:NAD(P)-dependent dehydrogenase, short-chain alcohol dehydrogenase family [Cryptosporangium aurantiacum]
MLPPGTYAGDVVLVTGGGTGLGRAMAGEFARLGARVAVVSRDEGHRAAGVAAIERAGGTGLGIGADVRDPASITAAFDAAEDTLGPVSVLVNNAAGNFQVPAESMSPNAWRAVTSIVLDGTYFCSREFAQRRIAVDAPGAILNIGATYGWTGGPGAAHSAAAKAAVANLTQTLSVEWGRYGIRVNSLAPGVFPHDDQDAHWGAGKEAESAARAATVPAGRVGQPHELGWAATYLCSPFAAYVSGHHFVIDGANWHRRHGFSMPPYVPIADHLADSSD